MAADALDIDADFDGFLVDYAQKGHRVEYAGMDSVGGKPAHHLKVTLRGGAERHVYLDPGTFLERRPDRHVHPAEQQQGEGDSGLPRLARGGGREVPVRDEDRDAMGQTYAVYVDAIEVNVPLDAALFAAPPGATAAGT